jgi:hypothetical protein
MLIEIFIFLFLKFASFYHLFIYRQIVTEEDGFENNGNTVDLSDCFLTGRRKENGEIETSRISNYSSSHSTSQNYGNQSFGNPIYGNQIYENQNNQNNGNVVTPSFDERGDERLDVRERERLENEIHRLMENGKNNFCIFFNFVSVLV